MAHILHAGGPWKLESPCRSQETGVNMAARQADKVPGGRWGPRVVESGVSLTAWAPKLPPKQTNTYKQTNRAPLEGSSYSGYISFSKD